MISALAYLSVSGSIIRNCFRGGFAHPLCFCAGTRFVGPVLWHSISPPAQSCFPRNRVCLGEEEKGADIMDAQLALFYKEWNALLRTAAPRELEQFLLDWQQKLAGEEGSPAWIGVNHELGLFYRNLGQYDRSIRVLEQVGRVLSRDKGFPYVSLLNNLAGTYRRAGDPEKAIALFQEAIEVCRKQKRMNLSVCASLYGNLSQCCQERGQWPQAIDSLERSLEFLQLSGRSGEMGLGYYNLALLYRNLEDTPALKASVAKALEWYQERADKELQPRDALALNGLGSLLYRERNYDGAARLYARAAQCIRRYSGKDHAYAVNRQHQAWALRGAVALAALTEAETICEGLYGRQNEKVQAVIDELDQLQQLLHRKKGKGPWKKRQ